MCKIPGTIPAAGLDLKYPLYRQLQLTAGRLPVTCREASFRNQISVSPHYGPVPRAIMLVCYVTVVSIVEEFIYQGYPVIKYEVLYITRIKKKDDQLNRLPFRKVQRG